MLTLLDEFCGLGGSTTGAALVPGVQPVFAANHSRIAVESHQANHPDVDHYLGDVQQITNVAAVFPRADLFWASPACPAWTDAKGVKRVFDRSNQLALWKEDPTEEELKAMRSRALMEEVVTYLRAMHDRGRPVLAGVVENVIQCRYWDDWDRWLGEIRQLGYHTRTVALNSMHVVPVAAPRCPQSRDRLYVAYWHTSLGRVPDWDKWLRPPAYCPGCDRVVQAIQVFKRPGQDMGRYGSQYVYRCPNVSCRNRVVVPEVLPAASIIDWDLPGTPIGARGDRLAPATLERIRAGIATYWTDRLTPFVTPLRGGGDRKRAYPVDRHLHTVTAGGTHHGLATPPPALLVQYYGTGRAYPVGDPIGTITTRDRYALATPSPAMSVELDDVLYRMLEPHELRGAMAFPRGYRVVAEAKKDKVRLLGNAVTPPAAEVLVSALVEAVVGVELDRGPVWEVAA